MDTATINRIKRRLRALGVKGNTGGWVCVNEPRVRALPDPDKRPQGFASIRIQGWVTTPSI